MADRHKGAIGRRQLLRTGIFGIIATAISALESGTVAADTETNSEKRKARYQANSAEVQNFYRVNRYPKR
jgi:predicted component of type VI protein secretion system